MILFALAGAVIGAIDSFIPNAWVGDTGETVLLFLPPVVFAGLAFAASLLTTRLSKRALTGLWVGLMVALLAVLIVSLARLGVSFASYNILRNDPARIHAWWRLDGSGSFTSYLILDQLVFFLRWSALLGPICALGGFAGGRIAMARRRDIPPAGGVTPNANPRRPTSRASFCSPQIRRTVQASPLYNILGGGKFI